MNRLNVWSASALLTLTFGLLISLPVVYADDASPPAEPSETRTVRDSMDKLRAEMPNLDLDELRVKQQEIMALVTSHAQDTQDLQARYQEARIEARDHETIRAMQDEINEMRLQLEAAIDELPGVKGVREQLERDKRDLYELLQFRAEIQRKVAVAEHEKEIEQKAEKESEE